MKPRVLQNGPLMATLERSLAEHFDVHPLAKEADPKAFLAARGGEFVALATSARFGADRSLIAAPDGRVFVNPTGNPGMASGGSGDVLSGMIGSLLVQSKDVLGAVIAAVYAHGLSGDLAAAKLGERPLIAGDIIKFLPAAVKSLEDAAR